MKTGRRFLPFYFLALLLIFSAAGPLAAQQAHWERVYHNNGDNYNSVHASAISPHPGGGYLAGYSSRRFGYSSWANFAGLALARISAQGDTLWTKGGLGLVGQVHFLGPDPASSAGGLVLLGESLGSGGEDTVQWGYYKGLYFYRLDSSGNVLMKKSLGTAFSQGGNLDVRAVRKDLDGGLLVCGSKNRGSMDIKPFAAKVRLDGSLAFFAVPAVSVSSNQQGRANWLEPEPPPSKGYLACVSGGNNFHGGGYFACHLDSAGNLVSERRMYNDPIGGYGYFSTILRAPQARYWVMVSYNIRPQFPNARDTTWAYLGLHDSSGTRIWGGKRKNAMYFRPRANQDGSLILAYDARANNTTFGLGLVRIASDSSVMWERSMQLPQANPTGQAITRREIDDVLYLEDESAVLFGNARDSTAARNGFWVARFSGLGRPYDPGKDSSWGIVAARPLLGTAKGKLLAYPNPSSSTVHIQGAPNKPAVLYSMQGQLVQTLMLDGQGRGTVNVSSLPKGVYVLMSGPLATRLVCE